MKVDLQAPFTALKGTFANCGMVFWNRNGNCLARGRVKGDDAQSDDQRKIRTYLTLASRNWFTLTDAQRDAWEAYTKRYFLPDSGEGVEETGIATYVRANVIRQTLGLAMTADAPTLPPPSPLTDIQQLGAQNPDTLGLTLIHGIADVTGQQVIVRMTAAMPTVARRPRAGNHRFVRGVSPNSAVALPVSGGNVIITPTRFIVNDTQRYGVEVRVVRTADGLLSAPVYGDFRKSV